MASVTDNPLVFVDGQGKADILSGGNFHGQPVALALDFAAIAVAELAAIAERRIEQCLNPDLSGLPPFLAVSSGLHSGLHAGAGDRGGAGQREQGAVPPRQRRFDPLVGRARGSRVDGGPRRLEAGAGGRERAPGAGGGGAVRRPRAGSARAAAPRAGHRRRPRADPAGGAGPRGRPPAVPGHRRHRRADRQRASGRTRSQRHERPDGARPGACARCGVVEGWWRSGCVANVLVCVELRDAQVTSPSLFALGEARRVAETIGATVYALVVAPRTRRWSTGCRSRWGPAGADKILLVEDPAGRRLPGVPAVGAAVRTDRRAAAPAAGDVPRGQLRPAAGAAAGGGDLGARSFPGPRWRCWHPPPETRQRRRCCWRTAGPPAWRGSWPSI